MNNTLNEIFFLDNFSERLLQSLPSYKLEHDEKVWITKFIQGSAECFNIIDEELKYIISDGIIHLHNIPAIIKLFADIYYLETIKKDIVNSKNIVIFIKFSLNVFFLLEPQFLLLSEIDLDIINNVIETSLSLLTMNLENVGQVENKIFKTSCCF